MAVDDKIRDEKLQYDINKEAANFPFLVASTTFFWSWTGVTWITFFFFSELWVTMVENGLTEILQAWQKYQMLHCDKTIFWGTFAQ